MSDTNERILLEHTERGIDLYILDTINEKNMRFIIRNLDEGLKTRFKNKQNDMHFVITYHLDAVGGDINCFFTFDEFISETKKKYPNVKFVSFAGHIDGVASLIYMLADERTATQKTYILFSSLFPTDNIDQSVTNVRNKVCRVLFTKGFKPDMIKTCLPNCAKDELMYCRDVCADENISTKYEELRQMSYF